MKKYRKIKYLLFGIAIFGMVFLLKNIVLSYYTQYSHPKITQEAIDLCNQYYPEQLITKEQAKLIIQGSINEDSNIRSAHHFYNSNTKKGILGNINARDWATCVEGNEDKCWTRAISEYQESDKDEAFKILGRILHLLEDMSVPAHTRLDEHVDGDSYEQWVEDYLAKNEIDFSLSSPVYYSNLDKYFDDIAGYSSKYFISADTNKKDLPVLSVRDGYSYAVDGNSSEIQVSRAKKIYGEYQYSITCDSDQQNLCAPIHQSYYEHLVPYVIPRLAGAIKLFFDEAGGAKVEKPLTFWEKAWDTTTTVAVNTWNTTTNVAEKVYDTTTTAAVKTWNTTSTFAVNTLNQTVSLTTSFAQNAYNSIKNVLGNPQTQQTGFTNINIAQQNEEDAFEQDVSDVFAAEDVEQENIIAAVAPVSEKIYSARLYAQSVISSLEPQQGATISVQFKNTGNVVWNKKDISLNVASVDASKFHYSSWLTGLRPTLQDQQQVKPLELAGFTFPIQAPATTGKYDLSFKLVYQDESGFHSMENTLVNWLVQIKNKIVNFVPALISPISSPVFEPVQNVLPAPAPVPIQNPISLPSLPVPQIIASLNIPLGFTFFPCNGIPKEEAPIIIEVEPEIIEDDLEELEEFVPLSMPIITTHNGQDFSTNVAVITLEGTKEARITNIYINSSTESVVYATTTSWAKELTLAEGENIFVAQGADNEGNWSATSTITIIYDATAPDVSLAITEYSMFSDTLTLNAASSDDDINYYNFEFQMNTTTGDWQLYRTITTDTSTSTSISFTGEMDDTIYYFRIKAADKAGNESYSNITSAEISTHPIVLNEIAWMGTEASGNDEWIELFNKSGQEINLENWMIEFDGEVGFTLEQSDEEFCSHYSSAAPLTKLAIMVPTCFDLTIPAHGYFLIERSDDKTVKDIAADWYGSFSHGGLNDNGVKITLKNTVGDIIDELDCGDGWFAGDKGQGSDTKKTMERVSAFAITNFNYKDTNDKTNWANNNEMVINGVDKKGDFILGTPKAKNSVSY